MAAYVIVSVAPCVPKATPPSENGKLNKKKKKKASTAVCKRLGHGREGDAESNHVPASRPGLPPEDPHSPEERSRLACSTAPTQIVRCCSTPSPIHHPESANSSTLLHHDACWRCSSYVGRPAAVEGSSEFRIPAFPNPPPPSHGDPDWPRAAWQSEATGCGTVEWTRIARAPSRVVASELSSVLCAVPSPPPVPGAALSALGPQFVRKPCVTTVTIATRWSRPWP